MPGHLRREDADAQWARLPVRSIFMSRNVSCETARVADFGEDRHVSRETTRVADFGRDRHVSRETARAFRWVLGTGDRFAMALRGTEFELANVNGLRSLCRQFPMPAGAKLDPQF